MGTLGFSKETCESTTENAGLKLATRQCIRLDNGSLDLTGPTLIDCGMNLENVLGNLSSANVNVTIAASQTMALTSQPEKLTVKEVNLTTNILTNIMRNPTELNKETCINAIITFCNMLEVKPDIISELWKALSSLTKDLENMTISQNLDQVCPQVAVKSNQINSTDSRTGWGLVSYQNPMALVGKDAIKSVIAEGDINNDKMEAYIFIPNNAFKDDAYFGFVLYKDASFFPTLKKKASTVLKTQVISGTVSGHTGKLKKPVTIRLRKKALNDGFFLESYKCAYWNYSVSQWLTDGCDPVNESKNETYFSCSCQHLTSFAVLMTVKANTLQYLDTISYIGCALSILGLLATIIAPIWMKEYRTSVNGKLQINLSVALLGVYITFLSGAISSSWANAPPEKSNTPNSKTTSSTNPFCTASTWFLHFFLLASFAWMCVQGIALYSSYNRLIQQMERSYFAAVSAGVAWGAPALTAIITISATEPTHTYRQEKICWLAVPTNDKFFSGKNVLLWAFLLPVSLMLLLNMMIFGLIMSKMVCNKKNLTSYKGDFKKILQRQFALIFTNTVMLGMCWIIGYFMLIDEAYSIFSTLFCILNSLQGVFIFLLCIMNMKAFQNRMIQPLKLFKREKKSNIPIFRLIIK
uniref:adhesion G-protein coupled receptor G7-like n=1 Tax=Pristiophorus japonicus TaxID=55135 RepID=UPI00398F7ABB